MTFLNTKMSNLAKGNPYSKSPNAKNLLFKAKCTNSQNESNSEYPTIKK